MTSMAYQPQIPMMMMMPNTAINPQQEKINRELFVGNTPPGTSELLILHFLNAAMRRVGLCEPTETPIVDSRVNNKFAFIELSTAEFATKALALNGIPFLGVFLKVNRPSKYSGPNVPSQTWQQLTGQVLPDGSSILDPEQEKLSRELFIGNTTPEMTESMIKEFLGNALQQVGLTNSPGNPIVACRVSGKFAFVELRTPQEATNALNLNNIPFLGTSLRVGRPSKWNGPVDHHGNWEDILAKYMSGELLPPPQQQPVDPPVQAPSHPPTRIVEIRNMVTKQDIADDQEYADIIEDTQQECSQFGQLLRVVIPRDGAGSDDPRVFLQYSNSDEASAAIRELQGRTFDGRQVQAAFFDEDKFSRQEYGS